MRLVDSHSHLQDARFDGDRDDVLARAADAGVEAIAVCGEDLASSEAAVALAAGTERPRLFATAGFHPHEAERATDAALAAIEGLARAGNAAAIGEIGLDFHREFAPRATQRRALDAQLELAARLGLPVSVHSRDAEAGLEPHLARFAARSPLAARGRPHGVLHCFGGTLEQALRYVELGFLVSLACSAGYRANAEARRVAAGLPLDALLVETDSPALPPRARRGERNEPAHVRDAVAVVAEARGECAETVADATAANALRLFGAAVGAPA